MGNKKSILLDEVLCEFRNEFPVRTSKNLRQEFLPWKCELTKEEIRVLRKYRIGAIKKETRNINAYLRNGILDNKHKNREVSILKGALKKARLKQNIATYRTVGKGEYEFLKNFNIGDRFENKDFKGSYVKECIYKNKTSAYAIYLIPKGYECAYINYWIAIFMFEKELLLNCGSKCQIVSIKKVFGKDCYIFKVT